MCTWLLILAANLLSFDSTPHDAAQVRCEPRPGANVANTFEELHHLLDEGSSSEVVLDATSDVFTWERELTVTRNITIRPAGRTTSIRSDCDKDICPRLMRISHGAHVTLCGMQITAFRPFFDKALVLNYGGEMQKPIRMEDDDMMFVTIAGRHQFDGIQRNTSGAAFRLANGSLAMVDCTIHGFFTGPSGTGGAIHVDGGGLLTLTRSHLSNNHARTGSDKSIIPLRGGHGGAISISRGGAVSLLDCTLRRNSARMGAGGAVCSLAGNTRLAMRNTTFVSNSALVGGAIFFSADPTELASQPHPDEASPLLVEGSQPLPHGTPSLLVDGCYFGANTVFTGGAAITVAPPAVMRFLVYREIISPKVLSNFIAEARTMESWAQADLLVTVNASLRNMTAFPYDASWPTALDLLRRQHTSSTDEMTLTYLDASSKTSVVGYSSRFVEYMEDFKYEVNRKNNSHGNESRASSDASGGASDQAYELPPVGKIIDSQFDARESRKHTVAIATSLPIEWSCPRGRYAVRLAAFANGFEGCPFACEPGTFDAGISPGVAGACSECPAGFYCPELGAVVPLPCPAGSHQNLTGADSSDSCVLCGPATYSAEAGNSNASCAPCPAGLLSSSDRTSCVPPAWAVRSVALALLLVLAASLCVASCLWRATGGRAGLRRKQWPLLADQHEIDEGAQLMRSGVALAEAEMLLSSRSTRELLCVACSPRVSPLALASVEIVEVAEACQWGPDRVSLCWGGRAKAVFDDLSRRPTHRLLFAGHTDAITSTGRSLGFTSPGGGLEPFDADQFVANLARFFPCRAVGEEGLLGGPHSEERVLKLVFLNGCKSEALGERLRGQGAECVVCWRTATRDDAARIFSARFFQVIAQLSSCSSSSSTAPASASAATSIPQASDAAALARKSRDYICAFDAAVEAIRNASRSKRRRIPRYVLADPEAPGSTKAYPRPVGLPVLLCDGAAHGLEGEAPSGSHDVRLPLPEPAQPAEELIPVTYLPPRLESARTVVLRGFSRPAGAAGSTRAGPVRMRWRTSQGQVSTSSAGWQ